MADFLGRGWAFPVGLDVHGRVAMADGEQDIAQAIFMILSTPRGQRVLRPEFGCRIHELTFAPNDANTAGLVIYYVEQALGMWEPRIRIIEVRAEPDPQTPGQLNVHIEYEIKTSHDRRSLVYPFYRIPGE
jgi:hypothetical protein